MPSVCVHDPGGGGQGRWRRGVQDSPEEVTQQSETNYQNVELAMGRLPS